MCVRVCSRARARMYVCMCVVVVGGGGGACDRMCAHICMCIYISTYARVCSGDVPTIFISLMQ